MYIEQSNECHPAPILMRLIRFKGLNNHKVHGIYMEAVLDEIGLL